MRSSFLTSGTRTGKYVRFVGLIFVFWVLKTQRQQLFFAYADIIPSTVNTAVLPDGQRKTWAFCTTGWSSLATHKCKKSLVTKNIKRWKKSCLESQEERRQERTWVGKPLAFSRRFYHPYVFQVPVLP